MPSCRRRTWDTRLKHSSPASKRLSRQHDRGVFRGNVALSGEKVRPKRLTQRRRGAKKKEIEPRMKHGLSTDKDRRVNICRIVAFRSAKAAFFRGAKGDTYFCAGPKRGRAGLEIKVNGSRGSSPNPQPLFSRPCFIRGYGILPLSFFLRLCVPRRGAGCQAAACLTHPRR